MRDATDPSRDGSEDYGQGVELPRPTENLPLALTSFVGREREMAGGAGGPLPQGGAPSAHPDQVSLARRRRGVRGLRARVSTRSTSASVQRGPALLRSLRRSGVLAARVAHTVALAVAMLGHHLFDVELIVSLTLVYGILTATLAG